MPATVDVLIPTCRRPAALAVTLAGVAAQTLRDLRVVVSDQTPDADTSEAGEVRAVLRVLRAQGRPVEWHRHLPARGMAEHRQFLLDRTTAPAVLYLDDDLVLEPDLVERMLRALRNQGCGFVGSAVIGPSFAEDVRPHEQAVEFWDGPVHPEAIRPGSPEWSRHLLHNAANILHVQQRLGLTPDNERLYKVAWVGGCVLYDAAKLREAGGFGFWRALPPDHCGEEVLAQLRLMARHGGCGLMPSGAYHQELPTTILDRRVDAPQVLRGDGPDDAMPAAPRVSVLMPTCDQAAFLRRAIDSLRAQTFADWELVVVDDGSTDDTPALLAAELDDPRIRLYRHATNKGMGAALNQALARSRGELIAYLPSDDVYHADHLAGLVAALDREPDAILAFSGVRYRYNRSSDGQIDGEPLQLVQVMHRRTDDRWMARDELVTDDLDRMYWAKLRARGAFVAAGAVTCEWVDHPAQRHKLLREPVGGINPYRARYRIAEPLRFHTTTGNRIDEAARYRRFRDRPDTPPAADGLKILLVGELAYNAERVLALEERGHTLYGLWMPDPYWYNAVGPLPFGHVRDLDPAHWVEEVRRIRPDVIYALLNWQAVPFAHRVLVENPGVPFVWHFKEGPFICLEKGTWPQLVELHARADGLIYSSPEMRDWFDTVVPGRADPDRTLVLDGDLPKRDWFAAERSPRLSDAEGEVNTVVPGRPIGLHPHTVADLARNGIHLHFYGDFTHGQWRAWIEKAMGMAPGYLHLHANVDQDRWVEEFSQYDAGWLHVFRSKNGGDLRRADWDDLNYPARIATLAAAGLPMLQLDNPGAIVAAQNLCRRLDVGVSFADMDDLGARLRDRARLDAVRGNAWRHREEFCFDAHADRLVDFFRRVAGASDLEGHRRASCSPSNGVVSSGPTRR